MGSIFSSSYYSKGVNLPPSVESVQRKSGNELAFNTNYIPGYDDDSGHGNGSGYGNDPGYGNGSVYGNDSGSDSDNDCFNDTFCCDNKKRNYDSFTYYDTHVNTKVNTKKDKTSTGNNLLCCQERTSY